jgi:cyclophilin family peptidyl-prolyl cis-trans isomerase
MNKQSRAHGFFNSHSLSRKNDNRKRRYRCSRIEQLEPRQVLASPTLAALPDTITVTAGAPLNVALNGYDTDANDILQFSVSSGNSSLVKASVLSSLTNPFIKISVQGGPNNSISGDMVFQLFGEYSPDAVQRIVQLIQTAKTTGTGNFYDGLTFHRVAWQYDSSGNRTSPFVIQGGDPEGDGTGGSGTQFDDQYSPELQFTSSGILAMAKSSNDTNDSQFFITAGATRNLDFRYTILGFLVSGDDIRQQIQNVATTVSSGTPTDTPTSTITITKVQVYTDTRDTVLHLSAPTNATGTTDVTIALTDGNGDPVTKTIHVNIVADTTNDPPVLGTADQNQTVTPLTSPIVTTAGTAVSYALHSTDVEGDSAYYWAGMYSSTDTTLTVAYDSTTGVVTITPKAGFVGVSGIYVGVRAASGSTTWDTQFIPVYVKPTAPTVSLLAASDTGASSSDRITSLNNTTGKTLKYRVSGVVGGAEVVLYADGNEIGRKTAASSETELIIETNGTFPLADGSHAITAKQSLKSQVVNVGNTKTTTDLESALSASLSMSIDTSAVLITSTPPSSVTEGYSYSYDVQSNKESQGAVYSLTKSPAGMLINSTTGAIIWTPQSSQGPTQDVVVCVTDTAGNSVTQSFQIQLIAVNKAPTAYGQTVATDMNVSVLITLTGNDNDTEVVQTLTFELLTQPANGTLTDFNAATGTVRYTPNPGYHGPDSFTFRVTDDDKAGSPANLSSDSATVNLQVAMVNYKPTANAQTGTTTENAAIEFTLTGDDGNTDVVQTLRYILTKAPTYGQIVSFDQTTGVVKYQPNANYAGNDSFQFAVIDDEKAGSPVSLTSDSATVSITMTPVNNAPSGTPQTIAVQQNTAQAIQLAAADNDPEVVQTLTYEIVDGPLHGVLGGFDPATGAVLYTPNADYSGSDTFTFKVTDDDKAGDPANLTSSVVTMTIHVAAVNAAPTANGQSVAVDEDNPLSVQLTGDDGDPEVAQSLRFTILKAPSHGRIVSFNAATGDVNYLPDPDYNGTDSFSFTVTDDDTAGEPTALTSGPAVVTIVVHPVDDAPRFTQLANPTTVVQTQSVQFQVQARDIDAPANAIRYSLEPGSPENAVIDPITGHVSWTVASDFPPGAFLLKVRATEIQADGQAGLSSIQTFAFNVVDHRIVIATAINSQESSRQNSEPSLTDAAHADASSSAGESRRQQLAAEALAMELLRVANHTRPSGARALIDEAHFGSANVFGGESLFEDALIGSDTGAGMSQPPAAQTESQAPKKDKQPEKQPPAEATKTGNRNVQRDESPSENVAAPAPAHEEGQEQVRDKAANVHDLALVSYEESETPVVVVAADEDGEIA